MIEIEDETCHFCFGSGIHIEYICCRDGYGVKWPKNLRCNCGKKTFNKNGIRCLYKEPRFTDNSCVACDGRGVFTWIDKLFEDK